MTTRLKTTIGLLLLAVLLTLTSITLQAKPQYIAKMEIQTGYTGDCITLAMAHSGWQPTSIHELKQSQRVCLRQTVTIDPTKMPTHSAVLINMLGARTIYWDGQRIGSDGTVGSDKTSEIPGPIRTPHLIPSHLLAAGEHQLVIEASTFHINESVSRLFYDLLITDYDAAMTQPLHSTTAAIFLIGALVLVSLFFQAIFWLYQRRSSYQIFSLLCLSSACLLAAEKFRALYGYTYDWHLTRLHLIMVFTFISTGLLPGFYLFYYQMKNTRYWITAITIGLLFALMIDPRYDAKSILMFAVSLLAALVINLLALKQRKTGAVFSSILFVSVLLIFLLKPLALVFSFVEQWFVLIYLVIILSIITTLIGEMKRNRAQALTSARLETELLRRNLQPHFLMNSLMLIIEWIEHKPQAAVQFVQSLSDELRMLIQYSAKQVITLEEEIALCRRHLEIMAHRYKADYQLVVNGQIEGIDIPPAIIHTQIENAFTHNRITRGAAFTLNISVDKNQVILELRSPYKQKSGNKKHSEGTGTGEKYIRARLKERFDQQYDYQSFADDQHWVNVIKYQAKEG
ncbi:MAG: histidine kinase [Algicola sp.]|nr:histidine kinase [Algicola sp.]